MRTTVSIDDDLLVAAKQRAARTRRSLGDVVNDALRVLLASDSVPVRSAVHLPVYGGSGLQPGVDLSDKESLARVLEDDPDPRAAR